MNYYENVIAESMDDAIARVRNGAPSVFSRISECYPLYGAKIDWRRLASCFEDRTSNLHRHPQRFEEFFHNVILRFRLEGDITYVGDGLTDFSLHGPIEKFDRLLGAIFDVPQHHYFLGRDLDWCMCFTMEGDMNFAFRDLGMGK